MVIIAKYSVELNGHIYRKGEVCRDYTGSVTKRIADNFTDEEGNALSVCESTKDKKDDDETSEVNKQTDASAKIAKCVEVLKRDGIMQALDGMCVTYSPKAKTNYLAKLLLMNKGEIEE